MWLNNWLGLDFEHLGVCLAAHGAYRLYFCEHMTYLHTHIMISLSHILIEVTHLYHCKNNVILSSIQTATKMRSF